MSQKINVYVVDYGRTFLMLQWTDPTTGKRHSQSSKCKTRREAERAASDLEKKLNSLRPNGDGLTPWANFVTFYSDEHLSSLAETSYDRAAYALNVFTAQMQPAVIRSVTASELSSYAKKLRNLGRSEQTIQTHFGILRTALRWGVDNGYSSEVPKFPRIAKARGTRAKGRPLTDDEFKSLLEAVTEKIVGKGAVPSWQNFLNGLWLSGLRLDEAIKLVWSGGILDEGGMWIDVSGEYPLLGISAESEKGKQDRLLPITPDFGRFVLDIPEPERTGYVFKVVKQRRQDTRNVDHFSKVISEIGKASKVVVHSSGKFASAHDLRRSFGLRWAQKTFPAELQQLMRHEDIDTTMKYYALIEATAFAKRLWDTDGDISRNEKTTENTTPQKNNQ